MAKRCLLSAVLGLAAMRLPLTAGSSVFSRLEAGPVCWDYRIPDVASKDECFGVAASTLGLSGAIKLQINGLSFSGCAFNSAANLLIFSESSAVTAQTSVGMPTLQFICNGIPTTTTTFTRTESTATTTTTSGLFTKLEPGSSCWDQGIPDVDSEEACFDVSVHYVGLPSVRTMRLDNIGFSGCVYNNAANILMYGLSIGVNSESSMKLPSFQYVCHGLPATSLATSSTSSATAMANQVASTTTSSTATASSTTTTTVTTTTTTTMTTTTTTTATTTMTTTTVTTTTMTTTTLSTSTRTAVYTKLEGGAKCVDYQMAGVDSKEACFSMAAHSIGLGSVLQMELDGIGFTGCIYNTVANILMYGTTNGVTPETTLTMPNFEYVCYGMPSFLILP